LNCGEEGVYFFGGSVTPKTIFTSKTSFTSPFEDTKTEGSGLVGSSVRPFIPVTPWVSAVITPGPQDRLFAPARFGFATSAPTAAPPVSVPFSICTGMSCILVVETRLQLIGGANAVITAGY